MENASQIEEIKGRFDAHVRKMQQDIIQELKKIDSAIQVTKDAWKRQDFNGHAGGGGLTCVLEGDIFESAGVNTSQIEGAISPEFAKQLNSDNPNLWASGISLIIHPKRPKIPTVHANFRMIQTGDNHWFGGGADLTPYYPFEEDFNYFHGTWQDACRPYGCYESMKRECDHYFTNHHREGEMRGVGGIFFDHFNSGDLAKDFSQVTSLSNYFIKSYFPIVKKRMLEK